MNPERVGLARKQGSFGVNILNFREGQTLQGDGRKSVVRGLSATGSRARNRGQGGKGKAQRADQQGLESKRGIIQSFSVTFLVVC